MNALKQVRVALTLVAGTALAFALAQGGCAGVKPQATTGTGGTAGGFGGSIGGPPPINGLESLDISPTTASVILTANAAGGLTSTPQQFTATGVVNGVSQDITPAVTWLVDLKGVSISGTGLATATAPGTYTITARSGNFQKSATLNATFSGAIFDPKFNQGNNNKAVLDATPSGTTNLLYP